MAALPTLHYLGSSSCSSLALRDELYFVVSICLSDSAMAYASLIFIPTNPHMTSWAHWLRAPKQPTFAMLCVYDNYEATRIQRIPFLVVACFFVVASICKLQGPSATTSNRRRPARSSRSLLGLQFFWHFRLKRGIAMPAVPDQRSRRVCSACACVHVRFLCA
jgi:hypothetical protein